MAVLTFLYRQIDIPGEGQWKIALVNQKNKKTIEK